MLLAHERNVSRTVGPVLAPEGRSGDAGETPWAQRPGGDLVGSAQVSCSAHHLERAASVGPYVATPDDSPLPNERHAPSRMVAIGIDSEPDPDPSVVPRQSQAGRGASSTFTGSSNIIGAAGLPRRGVEQDRQEDCPDHHEEAVACQGSADTSGSALRHVVGNSGGTAVPLTMRLWSEVDFTLHQTPGVLPTALPAYGP